MSPYERRDAETALMIRRKIEECKTKAKECGWTPRDTAWHRAFGEIAGMHRILEMVDLNANDVLPPLPAPAEQR